MSYKKNKSKNAIYYETRIILLSVLLFIIVITGSIIGVIFDKELYYKEYSKNNVYEKLSHNKIKGIEITENITNNIIDYFSISNDAKLLYFSDNEISHMRDVKNIINIIQYIYYITVAVFLILLLYAYKNYEYNKSVLIRIISKALLLVSIFSVLVLIIIFLSVLLDFDFAFNLFHQIFFPQGNWVFQRSSLLIILFPKHFFFNMSLRIGMYILFQIIIFFILSYWIYKKTKVCNKKNIS